MTGDRVMRAYRVALAGVLIGSLWKLRDQLAVFVHFLSSRAF